MSASSTTPDPARVGVWLIGVRGSVATTTVLGATGLAAQLVEPIGLVTELEELQPAGLIGFDQLVFGGHDVVETPLVKRAEMLVETGVIPSRVFESARRTLECTEDEIRHGYLRRSGEAAIDAIERLQRDITGFVERHQLAGVVVVNLSSVEPVASPEVLAMSFETLMQAGDNVPPSVVYALAAIRSGAAFVDFTPSAALLSTAVLDAALTARTPLAGRDGKTGETLVKATLAPMFARRNLRVRSWAGTNLLGGGDGATLATPEGAAAKLTSKAGVLEATLGYPVTAPLHIDYIEDAGEWKTAWDHIAFEGFLGARMTLQFTWHGCDSALAAPLVLDLVRLMARAQERREAGAIDAMGFFFKDPIASDQHALDAQFRELLSWVLDERR